MTESVREAVSVRVRRGKRDTLGVALLGAGTVGGGFVRLMEQCLGRIPFPMEIKRVGVRSLAKRRNIDLPPSLFSANLESIVADPEVDVVVEAMGGFEPARSLVEMALRNGKHVVTANKFVVSEAGNSLHRLAEVHRVLFLYEASVAASIPIIEILKWEIIPDKIDAVTAILNGTTNFILTRMAEYQEAFHSALAKAQELGFSEPDPSFDVSGKDASQKLSILISLLSGTYCHPAQIDVRGINFLMPLDFEVAAENDWAIKPLALFRTHGGIGYAAVEPALLPRRSVLANVSNEYNGIALECQNIGKQILVGKGAGDLPTASALWSDLKKVAAWESGEQSALNLRPVQANPFELRLSIEDPAPGRFYVRCSADADPSKQELLRRNFSALAERLEERREREGAGVHLVVMTRPVPHAEVYRALDLASSIHPECRTGWLRILEAG
ncbi:MAG: homoserine dehydrogenase [Acidobacteriota bacterium]